MQLTGLSSGRRKWLHKPTNCTLEAVGIRTIAIYIVYVVKFEFTFDGVGRYVCPTWWQADIDRNLFCLIRSSRPLLFISLSLAACIRWNLNCSTTAAVPLAVTQMRSRTAWPTESITCKCSPPLADDLWPKGRREKKGKASDSGDAGWSGAFSLNCDFH